MCLYFQYQRQMRIYSLLPCETLDTILCDFSYEITCPVKNKLYSYTSHNSFLGREPSLLYESKIVLWNGITRSIHTLVGNAQAKAEQDLAYVLYLVVKEDI